MARIKPSQRVKKRYLAFEVESKHNIESFPPIENSLRDSLSAEIKDKGRIKLIKDKWNSQLKRGLIRVNNKYVKDLRASLGSIATINKEKVHIKTIGASGILKKAEAKYLSTKNSEVSKNG